MKVNSAYLRRSAVCFVLSAICAQSLPAVEMRPWGPEQASGAPDSQGPGDIVTAWASLTQDDQDEWLELHYQADVIPAQLRVFETYNPGAVVKITALGSSGEESVLWQGVDPLLNSADTGVAEFALNSNTKIHKIKLYLASPTVPGWNEIDAVELIAKNGKRQWASLVSASSTYAEQASTENNESNVEEGDSTAYSNAVEIANAVDEFTPYVHRTVKIRLDNNALVSGKLLGTGKDFLVLHLESKQTTLMLNKSKVRSVEIISAGAPDK